jgi:hypothetical protein
VAKMRFNHMELTFPKGTFGEEFYADLEAFYGGMLGWEVTERELGKLHVYLLRPDTGQFILLAESDKVLSSPGMDHLGLLVDTRLEVDETLEACRRFADKDSRVEIIDFNGKDLVTPTVTVHAFYVRYLLPIYLDVQCMEHVPGHEPAESWAWS